jgi:hypothetical protein
MNSAQDKRRYVDLDGMIVTINDRDFVPHIHEELHRCFCDQDWEGLKSLLGRISAWRFLRGDEDLAKLSPDACGKEEMGR